MVAPISTPSTSGQRDDLSCACAFDFLALQPFERVELGDFALPVAFVRGEADHVVGAMREQHDRISNPYAAALDPTNGQPAEVWRMVDGRDQHLERSCCVTRRRWHARQDGVEQRREIARDSFDNSLTA